MNICTVKLAYNEYLITRFKFEVVITETLYN